MTVYVYDTTTFFFLGIDDRGVVGVNATTIQPPARTDVLIPKWNGASWDLVNDPDVIAGRIAVVRRDAKAHVRSFYDEFDTDVFGMYATLASNPAWRVTRLTAIRNWWSTVAVEVNRATATIRLGTDDRFRPEVIVAPTTFAWDLVTQ